MSLHGKKTILRETFLVWIITVILIRLLHLFRFVPFVVDISSLATAVILLYGPLSLYFLRREKIGFLDNSTRQFLQSLTIAFVFSFVIFFTASAVVAILPFLTFKPHALSTSLSFFFTQLVMVALPEEFFFRGYLQGRWNLVFEKRRTLLGVPLGAGFLITAIVFAFSHSLIYFQAWHALIFFPALGFGWLREKTGSITAPILFHALCNLFSYFVLVS